MLYSKWHTCMNLEHTYIENYIYYVFMLTDIDDNKDL